MQPTQDTYPVFEANQVLTNAHLNQVFNYLDEQERLTRANLIGIGIVCGLDIRLDVAATTTLHLTKGCGVTSEGYLIVEPEDVALVSYRAGYKIPNELDYPTFKDRSTNPVGQYPLWELFPAGEPDTTALGTPAGFLDDKAVLLFLELKKEGLRNCSPNNCDDKGAEVTATVRRLLIRRDDLNKMIAEANQLGTDLTLADLEASLLARLNLPDLRLPRYDAPNTGPATSQAVLAAFHAVFRTEALALRTGQALTAAYDAFRPVVQERYPVNPFANFSAQFSFLDQAPATTHQVRFLPYYYDFFDDLLRAYEEFRWKGVELLCACCPPGGLFPRHLMLGVLFPASVPNPGLFRHHFLKSGAVSGCEALEKELKQLFQRLVEMIAQFTNNPSLPPSNGASRTDGQIRVTPSKLADAPLSDKAIPYYYQQTGTPPLFQLWNPARTRRNRANQNLSYRSDEYTPPAPPFVTNALRYDLEPYNFLRIEGHLGKNYRNVLNTLLSLKSRHRLPIEIIALRTGAFDEKIPVDLSKETCRFQDLEALYDSLRAELTCFLCKEVQYFYQLPHEFRSKVATPTQPKLALLVQCAPGFLVQPRTLGRLFEDWLAGQPGGAIPDIDPGVIINFLNAQNVGQSNLLIFYIIIYIAKLFEQLTPDLGQLDFANFEKRYQDLVSVTEAIEREREQAVGNIEGNANLLSWEELDDRLEAILFQCHLAAFRALLEEYKRRLREVRQKQFLRFFLRNHPGIQHKAGVPLGGTFILVYHDDPEPVRNPGLTFGGVRDFAVGTTDLVNRLASTQVNTAAVAEAFNRISANRQLALDPDIRFLLGTFTGLAPDLSLEPPAGGGTEADKIIDAAVNELPDGTVIADFYLPYLCCSDCSPVQFVLPNVPPTFTVQIGCSNPNNQAEVTIAPEGGVAPYSVKVDDQDYQPLRGVLLLSAGPHTLVIRDAEATESVPQTIEVAPQLGLGNPVFDCIGDQNEYVATFQINGGVPPYAANRGTVNGNTYASDALPGDTDVEIRITDSRSCQATQTLRHSCLPGLAFTTQVGCTNSDNVASVQILPTGGTAPYQVQVGTEAPVPVGDPLSLPAGSYPLVVSDADGATTAAQTVMVAAQLVLSEADFLCNGTDTYRAVIRIEGGVQPYTVNGALVTGNLFTTDPVANGASVSVEVRDQNNCAARIEVQHTCEDCDLPCGGQSRRCAYRLWLQPPVDGAPYENYTAHSSIQFRFNDKTFTLTGTIIFLGIPLDQLNGDFQNAFGRLIKKLNAVINQTLVDEFGPAGNNRWVITYEPAATDPFGILWIEHFVCETFNLEFDYSFAKPTPAYSLNVRYTNEPDVTGTPFDGAIFTNRRLDNKETRVPAFDCSERNQCTGSIFQKLCEGPEPKPALSIEPLENNRFRLEGNVENMPVSEVVAWVWDFFIAQPTEPFYAGQKTESQLQKPEGPVRLTAITRKGCFNIVQKEISQ